MKRHEHRFVAMGGPCRLRLDCTDENLAQQACNAAETEVRRLESKYSRYLENSITSQINRAAGTGTAIAIDDETAGLLDYADTLFRESDGLFDLTSGILRQAWDFRSGKIPAAAEIDALLSRIGWDKVERVANTVALPSPGMEIDFGGCVKEYASDSAAAVLAKHGIKHALVDLAGDIAALNGQFNEPFHEQPWQIGIRHPREQGHAIAQVSLISGGLATSGDYERCIELDGTRYGHILNPHTGWPSQGLIGVSLIAEQCLVAGSTATIAMLKPAAEALEWLAALGLPWLAIDAELACHGTLQHKP